MEAQKENQKNQNEAGNVQFVDVDLHLARLSFIKEEIGISKQLFYSLKTMLCSVADHYYFCSDVLVDTAMSSLSELIYNVEKKIEEEDKELKGGNNGN